MTYTHYEFDRYLVDVHRRMLRRHPERNHIDLPPKAFDALLYFVERAGELLGKRELIEALWPDVVVEENSLNQVISQLRKALGEKPSEHRYIVTSPGRGYRFVAAVDPRQGEQRPTPPATASRTPRQTTTTSFLDYVKAVALMQKLGPENLAMSIELLRQSVEVSPEFAKAHSLLAIQYTTAAMFSDDNVAMLELARQAIATALAVDENNGETWCAAAVIDCLGGVWVRAEERIRYALTLTTDPMVCGLRSAYLTMSVGHLARAIQQAEFTLQAAPAQPLGVQMLASLHMALGNDEEARRFVDLAVDLGQPKDVAPLADVLAVLELRAGNNEEMRRILALPGDPLLRKRMMLWHTIQGDLDAAFALGFEALDIYSRSGTIGGLWGVLWLPEMLRFREDDRFQLFARRLRLFEYWMEYGPPDYYSLVGERLIGVS